MSVVVVGLLLLLGASSEVLPLLDELETDHFHTMTPDDAGGCLDGSPFSFFTVPRTNSKKLVIELIGGGACWDLESCQDALENNEFAAAVPAPFLAQNGAAASTVATIARLFLGLDFLFDEEPFDDTNYVIVPYCTQDIHVGSSDVEYGGNLTTFHHRGWQNVQSVVDWAVRHNDQQGTTQIEEVIVTGCSAGAVGAMLLGRALAKHFEKVTVVSDSYVGVVSDEFVQRHLANWKMECAINQDFASIDAAAPELQSSEFVEFLYRQLLLLHPNVHVGFYTQLHDKVQMGFLRDMGGVIDSRSDPEDQERFARLAQSMLGRLLAEFPTRVAAFVTEGNEHCDVALDTARTVDGFGEWFDKFLNNTGIYNNSICEECVVEAMVGCDGVQGSGLVESHCMTCEGACNETTGGIDLERDIECSASTAQPASSPTAASCGDSATWHKSGNEAKDCLWVAMKNETRCNVKDDDAVRAFEECSESCGVCDTTTCEDDPSWRKAGNDVTKDCSWVQRVSNRCAQRSDAGDFAFEACPRACGTCGSASPVVEGCSSVCGDSSEWHKKNDATKDCVWVARSPEKRCRVKDADAKYAFEACSQTCGGCDSPCEAGGDSATWHKGGNPEEDCNWVKRVFNRCAVTGEDGTLAFQSCKEACQTCDSCPTTTA